MKFLSLQKNGKFVKFIPLLEHGTFKNLESEETLVCFETVLGPKRRD